MVSLQRCTFHHHLLDRICDHLANGQGAENSSPAYATLWNFGIIPPGTACILSAVLVENVTKM
jgi:hypothetical protein